MQLDKTEIVIRQRSAVELLDLSLLVLRRHYRQIVLTSAVLGLPLLVLNGLLTYWMLTEDAYLAMEHLDAPQVAMRWRHFFHNVLLFILQYPLISLPTTVFLGNQIFFEPVTFRSVLSRVRPLLLRAILILGFMRIGLLCLAPELVLNRNLEWDWLAEFWLFLLPGLVVLFIRASWPFAPEILGLELCTLRKRNEFEITYAQRARGLHRLVVGDNIARHLGASLFALMLTMMCFASALWVKGVITNSWVWNDWCSIFVVPLALWCVGLFMTVFRFLSYLDTRIRLEGWEIELRLKAEAARMESLGQPPATAKVAVGTEAEEVVQT